MTDYLKLSIELSTKIDMLACCANILSALKKSIVDERASESLVMEAELKQAILAEELYLQYQPQFDLSDNSLVGMEALVRWKHPVKGIVPPGDFIILAE